MKSQVLALVSAVALGVSADTFYVDDDNYGQSGNGSTPATAYGTIQEAVDAAPDGSTILVLPGTYDQGVTMHKGYGNRVVVNGGTSDTWKKLTIRATGGRAETKIVGKLDPDDTLVPGRGVGPKAVRPVKVYASQLKPVVFEGFSIVGGSVHVSNDSEDNHGGAVLADGPYAVCVNCDISGNFGSRAITYKGTYVRCFFHDNEAGKGAANWLGTLLNCVVTRTGVGSTLTGAKVINCTVEDNSGNIFSEGTTVKNSICLRSDNTEAYVSTGQYISGTFTRSVINISRHFSGSLALDGTENVNLAPFIQCVAPMFDDYRLLETSDALGRGDPADLAAVTLPADVDAFVDFYGNPIPKTGRISAGAVQETVVPAGGAMVFSSPVVDVSSGRAGKNPYGYAFATEYPVQWHIKPVLAAGEHLYGFEIPGVTNGGRFPEMDETLWTMPPSAGMVVTNTVRLATKVLYVNPTAGSDEGEGRGTAEAPFETLQAAVDAVTASYAVILAAEGEYAKGGSTYLSHSNRVSISKAIRLKGQGAGRSVIVGASCTDPGCGDYSEDGRGATAMRCVGMGDVFAAVQGFTLTGGRSAFKNGADDASTRGGAACCNGGEASLNCSAFFLDCLFTDNVAARGSVTYLGNLFRCTLMAYRGQQRYGRIHSCLILPEANQMNEVIGGGNRLYQCTAIGTATVGAFSDNAIPAQNTIAMTGPDLQQKRCSNFDHCLAWDFGTSYANSGIYVKADPEFVDAASGDYDVHGSSPAINCGVFTDDYWKTYSSDRNGCPLVFVDGKPLVGAFHEPLKDRAAVEIVNPSDKGTVEPTGRQFVNAGDSLTVTATDGARHIEGFVVDGAFVAGTSYLLTAPVDRAIGTVKVLASYSTNWYVNANTDVSKGIVGNDANDGFTPTTPKHSLKAAVSVAGLEQGDVIHAAPGSYEEGEMPVEAAWLGSDATTPVRVVVRKGITLVSDEGAERTIIRGHLEATSSSVPFGKNPVRCVNVANGGKVVGFTLTGGSAAYASSSGEQVPYTCGAVIAPQPTSASSLPIISDCIISNNWACRGGVSYGGFYRNCRMLENHCTESCPTFSQASLVNCLIDRNEGGTCLSRFPYVMRNVTMTATNYGKNGAAVTYGYILDADAAPGGHGCGIANCIILGPQVSGADASRGKMNATNCIFLADAYYSGEDLWVGCRKLTVAEVALDAEGRPTKGSLAIDFGDNGYIHPESAAGDIDGRQRVSNGTVDAGCFEYDWRPDYAAAIGGGVTVEVASAGVRLEDGKVRISAGETVAGTWPAPSGKGHYTVPLAATDGTLTGIFVNEAAGFKRTVAVTDDSATEEFKLANSALDFAFGFEGSGYGELAGFDCTVLGMILLVR